MKNKKILSLVASTALFTTLQSSARSLTTYVTEWAGYGSTDASSYQAYPIDGSYLNGYQNPLIASNPDMKNKSSESDIISYAFLQVWNQNLITQYGAPQGWLGTLHFDDLWANLSNSVTPDYPMWSQFCKTGFSPGTCSAVQLNGNTGKLQLFDYTTTADIGQMNNFGAFLRLPMVTGGRKVISIGGANTLANNSVSTQTFQTIFSNQTAFLNSLSSFFKTFNNNQGTYSITAPAGIDFDFEPPIDASGGQLSPDVNTSKDYQNLYNLIVATRSTLGADAYISVTLTSNQDYLKFIQESEAGGWFKQISSYVNAINIMTYDMHGAWSISSDPGALSHEMFSQPSLITKTPSINYGAQDVINTVLGYGATPNKIQLGIASYGRGFAGVPAGSNTQYPGFDQTWTGVSQFETKYSNQTGLLPYKFVHALLGANYQNYNVYDNSNNVIASYIYSPTAQQFVGYVSPELIDTLCTFEKNNDLGGAILWSMDTDASSDGTQGESLVNHYNKVCK